MSLASLAGAAAGRPGLRRQVRDLMGLTKTLAAIGELDVRLATTKAEIRRAQKLRYRVFFEDGGAKADPTARLIRRDVCRFDRVCDHLIIVDNAIVRIDGKPTVIGACRLLRDEVAAASFGFYSAGEFDVVSLIARHPGKRLLELGRSCVAPAYRSNKRAIELMWRGIWAYARHHRVDAIFGCASFPGAEPNFPATFGWPFNQNNATTTATFTCTGVITCNAPSQSISSNGLLSGILGGTLNSPGTFTIGGTASGYTLPQTTFNVYGGVTMTSPASTPISFTQVPSSQQVTVTQLPTGSTLTAAINCPGGSSAASVTLTGATGPSPLTFTVTANSAPTSNPPPTVACTIIVAGQGDGPRASLTIPVNVTSTGIGVETHRRKPN